MAIESTAMIMLGMQEDYFSPQSPLASQFREQGEVLDRNLAAATRVHSQGGLVVHVPLQFAPGYPEIADAPGLLATIKGQELFQPATHGVAPVSMLHGLSQCLTTLPGRTGFNAFNGSGLDELLSSHRVRRLLLGGAAGLTCIDSTARMAFRLGYEVVILDDCILFRSPVERSLLCNTVFSQYAVAMNSDDFLGDAV